MNQLTFQLMLGGGLTAVAIAIQAVGVGLGMMARPWLARHIGRMTFFHAVLLLAGGTLWMMFWQILGVWVWCFALVWVGAFDSVEPALYYAIAAYTTLGFGDVVPPDQWRIFGAVCGANGMIAFGLAAAALVEFLRGLRPIESGRGGDLS